MGVVSCIHLYLYLYADQRCYVYLFMNESGNRQNHGVFGCIWFVILDINVLIEVFWNRLNDHNNELLLFSLLSVAFTLLLTSCYISTNTDHAHSCEEQQLFFFRKQFFFHIFVWKKSSLRPSFCASLNIVFRFGSRLLNRKKAVNREQVWRDYDLSLMPLLSQHLSKYF